MSDKVMYTIAAIVVLAVLVTVLDVACMMALDMRLAEVPKRAAAIMTGVETDIPQPTTAPPTETPIATGIFETRTPVLLNTPTQQALTETSYIEPIRKEIFNELIDVQGGIGGTEEARIAVAQRWGIAVDVVKEIVLEGIEKGWFMPRPVKASPTPKLVEATPTPRPVKATFTPTPPTLIPTQPPQPTPVPQPARRACCRICTTGKACGDSCISRSKTCHKPPGCACNGY